MLMSCASTTVLPLAAALALLSGAALAQSEVNPDEARLAFNNHCRQCHVTREGDNRLGPSLYGVFGREAGAASGFAYSSAMKNSDIVWDAGSLDRYIQNPDAVVPGNKMKPFTGISDAEERAKIIAHLENETAGQ
jgi:cytochrome c